MEVGFHKFRGNLKLHHWNERARRGTEIYPQCRTHSGFPLLIPKFGRPRFCSLFSYAGDIRPHYSARSEIYWAGLALNLSVMHSLNYESL